MPSTGSSPSAVASSKAAGRKPSGASEPKAPMDWGELKVGDAVQMLHGHAWWRATVRAVRQVGELLDGADFADVEAALVTCTPSSFVEFLATDEPVSAVGAPVWWA